MTRSRALSRKKFDGSSRRLLLSFDIGTTFIGISYSILDPGNVPEIKPVTRYPCQEHAGGDSKIPPVIYYDSEGRPQAIGAETLKEGIEADTMERGWRVARWFKLHTRPWRAATTTSVQFFREEGLPPLPPSKTVEQVFADYMSYLKECAKAYISKTHGENLWVGVEDDIVYVLTHPNGWGGPQQAQLRQSAVLAGLVPNSEEGAASLTFVTEGEASLYFCLSNGLKLPQKKGEAYGVVIVDAGGGTIDLTAYRKLPNHTFAEIAVPQCHLQGSAYMTMRAQAHFEDLLDGSRYTADVDTLTNRFDRNTKHVFKSEQEAHHIQFASARERDSTLNIRGGRLTLSGWEVAKFFEPTVKCVVEAIKGQESTAQYPIQHVFLVGGFSASQWLFEHVKREVEPLGIAVSRPDTHVNKAVSDGAASFYIDGVIFETILPKGTMVKKTYEYRQPYLYGAKDRKELRRRSLDIISYLGRSSEPRHWIQDEPDMHPIVCAVEADTSGVRAKEVTDPLGGVYYQIKYEVVLLFGLTELKAQLAWEEDGAEQRGPASIVYED